MKTGMLLRPAVAKYDRYALIIFFGGTTLSLFTKKYYLFDGFRPIFYAALFGFMMSLVFRTILKRDVQEHESLTGKKNWRVFILNSFIIFGIDFLLLCLALFIVWYISRLQGIIVFDDISFWPSALLLCACLGLCYTIYAFIEDRFNSKMFG
ncbi:MAG: hypothetical protein HYR66_06165 [Sphingobacteriales bacterium]|nr:hypothetical protein [Sphingobacteriales bacterium]MBI3719872.1 hypothetical protein [Sphingobacteriales bacterium]